MLNGYRPFCTIPVSNTNSCVISFTIAFLDWLDQNYGALSICRRICNILSYAVAMQGAVTRQHRIIPAALFGLKKKKNQIIL